ncbi:helix-turn-helix domain-containing protein [Ralstonia insidiosa]|uniref:helix-turn-helix transcriptional regulator n=1 Tax=Ralstonia insidiosa TaxID=190721 RepID=UPI001243FE1C|nr:helix-turn-helix domain-containing protein [Ralstonia insidiosa]KAB0472443.1 helix-turn-helix domain-containing protein [Ralstonia insidiosa]MBY4907964.1 helix-turn-helix domain-containing protein [Ralstonia insidiosa]
MSSLYQVELLTLSQLCPLLHRKASTVYSDIAAGRFDRLPPILRLPGQRRLLWRKEDVVKWIERHVQPAVTTNEARRPSPKPTQGAALATPQAKKGGRPTKRQQLERRLIAAGGGK